MINLAELMQKAREATPGEWRADYSEHPDFGEESYIKAGNETVVGTGWHDGLHLLLSEADAQFIASASPSTILALCEIAVAAKALHETLDRWSVECPSDVADSNCDLHYALNPDSRPHATKRGEE